MRRRHRDLKEHLRQKLHAHPASCYVIGYSGGLDSTVLLHLAVALKGEFTFRALHINHRLSSKADLWQEQCEATSKAFAIPFQAVEVEVSDEKGESLEAAARKARYRAFEVHLGEGEILLLAHHAGDQSETVFFHLLRGGGLKGLSGMPEVRPLGRGKLLRPLLEFEREDLRAYAKAHGLSWIEDESNGDLRFDRNFLRHEVFPKLKQRWPRLERTLARCAAHLAESQALLDELTDEWLARVEAEAGRLEISRLLQFPRRRQKWILRRWIEKTIGSPPTTDQLERILREIIGAGQDRSPELKIGDHLLRRHRGRLLIEKHSVSPKENPQNLLWPKGQSEIQLPDGSRLVRILVQGGGISRSRWEVAEIEIRYRRGGEVLRIPGRGRRSLKKWLWEQNIPPWQRNTIPLIYLNGELAAVADLLVCESFLASQGELAYRLQWRKKDGKIDK